MPATTIDTSLANNYTWMRSYARVRTSRTILGANDINGMSDANLRNFVNDIVANYASTAELDRSRLAMIISEANTSKRNRILQLLAAKNNENASSFATAIRDIQNSVPITSLNVSSPAYAWLRPFARVRSSRSILAANDINAMSEANMNSFVNALAEKYTSLSAQDKNILAAIIRSANSAKRDRILALLDGKNNPNARNFASLVRLNPSSPLANHPPIPIEYFTPEIVDTIYLSSSSSGDYRSRAARLNALFSGENQEATFEQIRDFLVSDPNWLDQSVVELFSGFEKVTKGKFIEIIRQNVLAHNKNRDNPTYCRNLGIETGRIFQLCRNFRQIDIDQARQLVTTLEGMGSRNSSEVNRILTRAKALNGAPNAWSDQEIITAYIALALRKADEVMERLPDGTKTMRIGHSQMLEAYGIDNDILTDTRQVRGRLRVFNGNPESQGYVRWTRELTNDDNFMTRDRNGRILSDIGYVDVAELYVPNGYTRRTNRRRGGAIFQALQRIGGVFYEIKIRDNRYGHGSSNRVRYVNGRRNNTRPLEDTSVASR